MKRLAALPLAIATLIAPTLLAGPAQAAIAPGDTLPNGRACPVVVSFGSYAMGIDQTALRKAKAYAARSRGVRVVSETPWGREGERTLCMDARTKKEANRAFEDLRAIIRVSARTGPTTVATAAGRTWTSQPRQMR